ncbi:hypothetical protein BOTBODRAFT_147618 [Botryobasidium botryosum FD-172 SS1]|uniref:SnoaL-like domain-containing protein n=1 Tax=Botryobasidium botryosum (strain FD-172 SS1) TaxID=930990 RepID=A0A067M7M9_BOTB1|nr:hypothetical protein BOTBODRAFT_147618 [Botryobasidium botryosum FD-172 SS1]
MATDPSPQLQVVLGWLDGFDRLDFDAANACTTEDVMYEILPASFGIAPFTKEGFKKHYETFITPTSEACKLHQTTVIDVIENPGKMFINGYSVYQPSGRKHEFNLRVNFEGDKIKLIKLFLDGQSAEEFGYMKA